MAPLRTSAALPPLLALVTCTVASLTACGPSGTNEELTPVRPRSASPRSASPRSSAAPAPSRLAPAAGHTPDSPAVAPSEPAPDLPPASDERVAVATETAATPGTCSIASAPVPLVRNASGPAAITATASSFLVAVYTFDEQLHDAVTLVELDPRGRLTQRGTISLPPPPPALANLAREAPPALTLDAARVPLVVATSRRGEVIFARSRSALRPGASLSFATTLLGNGADTRLAPTLVARPRDVIVAYTDSSGTPMRVRTATLAQGIGAPTLRDATPVSMGATAPVFVAGASETTLAFIDARQGISPIVARTLDDDGNAGEPRVLVPVGNVWSPPALAAAQIHGETWLAYSVVGNLAAAAIGLVRSGANAAAPVPLVRGIGYQPLHVHAAIARTHALFVADSPDDATAHRMHVEVRVVTPGTGQGEPLVLRSARGEGHHPDVAALADGELAAVVYLDGRTLFGTFIRCRAATTSAP